MISPCLSAPCNAKLFREKVPLMLKRVKVGDKVQLEAEGADGGFTVTKTQDSK
jgi:hypothetical protein